MEEVERLSAYGYKITPQRQIILEILRTSDRHLSAEEVAHQVKKIQPSISVATIYRNLNLLVKVGLVSPLELNVGPVKYELNQGHNHHLVCLSCGMATKIGVCPMQGEVEKAIAQNGFKVNRHHFEIMGYCSECQEKLEVPQE